ncbi:MAG: hypothetical protein AAGG48_09300 [Planctomycetota bacterium]
MADPLDESGRTTVNLVRSSHPWTEADNAAGFVLRYLAPMRRMLIKILGSPQEADEALKRLLTHLVSAGFGSHRKGKLRDFLLKGVRSAAKRRMADLPVDEAEKIDLDELTLESKTWITFWREGLLERAWRSLERQEHSSPDLPVYSVLHCATAKPQATPAMLVVQVASEFNVTLDETSLQSTLVTARALFAQLIADEVAETLENPNREEVKSEIAFLGLGKAFSGVTVVANDKKQ